MSATCGTPGNLAFMKIRRSVIIGIAILIVGIILFKILGGRKTDHKVNTSFQTINVMTSKIENQDIPVTISLSGKLVARNRIELISEVNGILLSGDYREGASFNDGQTIARIDDSELAASIKSSKSQLLNGIAQILPDLQLDFPSDFPIWQQFHRDISFDAPLPQLPEVRSESLKTFLSARNIYANYYTIRSQETRLAKHRIKAPFSGVLVKADIHPGTLVRAGQPIGTLIQPGTFELEASAGLDDLKYIKTGDQVVMKSNEQDGSWKGTILRINRSIDAATQSVKVYIGVSDPSLREGQYLTASINGVTLKSVSRIPRKLVLQNDEMFFVERDSVLTKKTLNIAYRGAEDVYVKDLANGQSYLNQVVNSAYEGMIVHPIAP